MTKQKAFTIFGVIVAAGWLLSLSEGLGSDWIAARIQRARLKN